MGSINLSITSPDVPRDFFPYNLRYIVCLLFSLAASDLATKGDKLQFQYFNGVLQVSLDAGQLHGHLLVTTQGLFSDIPVQPTALELPGSPLARPLLAAS